MAACCPRCRSQQPHLHPALQHEGEVQPCPDPFHRTVTPSNTPERIAKTDALLASFAGCVCPGPETCAGPPCVSAR